MSPVETAWRLRTAVRELTDRCASSVRRKPVRLSKIVNGNGAPTLDCSRAFAPHVSSPDDLAAAACNVASWRKDATERAEPLLRNRLSIFDMEDHDFGPEIDWNLDYASKKKTPMSFAPSIDYRDYEVVGDAKIVWEPNRHHHLVVLGRAYRLTGDRRYAEKVIQDIDSWIRQCPYGRGMNWRSPLEEGIRLINWVWALELTASSKVLTTDRWHRLLPVAYRTLWDISRRYSRYSSANNHLVGEAAGVFVGSSYFSCLKNAAAWQKESREILSREIIAQTNADGGHCELAMGYHLFVLQFFLVAGLAARRLEIDFSNEYWDRLERMFEFVAAFASGGSRLPMFGDCDDGYVLDLGGKPGDVRELLAVGAALFGRSDFEDLAGGFSESAFWLLGSASRKGLRRLDTAKTNGSVRSRALPGSGYYLLQSGRREDSDPISLTFDCGDLGLGSLAAHGHADALSFTLRAFGSDVFVDPGTYDYFSFRKWRDYFRSTRAHNTVTVDDRDQSEMLGPFLWGRRATARRVHWEPSPDGGTVVGEHDGFACLADPVIHRRSITLDGPRATVTIRDELTAKMEHNATLYLHMAEDCQVFELGANRYRIDFGCGRAVVSLDRCLSVRVVRGSQDPILGWVSRGYHRKSPSPTLVGQCAWTGKQTLETWISLEKADA